MPVPQNGLTSAEAERRLAELGPNELSPRPGGVKLRLLVETVREPIVLLLLGAGILYLLFGEPRDSILILVFLVVIIGLDFYQGAQTENALAALRALSQPEVQVVRDGTERLLPARDLVPGTGSACTRGTGSRRTWSSSRARACSSMSPS